jgi:hypothetical protein
MFAQKENQSVSSKIAAAHSLHDFEDLASIAMELQSQVAELTRKLAEAERKFEGD